MKLIITASIKKAEFEQLSKIFSLKVIQESAKKSLEGLGVGPHFAHISHGIEKVLLESFSDLQKGKDNITRFKKAMQNLLAPDTLVQLSSPMRRMLYEVGAL